MGSKVKSVVAEWAVTTAYADNDRDGVIEQLATRLTEGEAGAQHVTVGGLFQDATDLEGRGN